MSYRSSIVSQYFYCDKCAEVLATAISANGTFSRGAGWFAGQIVVTFASGIYEGESADEVESMLLEIAAKFCHPVRVAVIDEVLGPVAFLVQDCDVLRDNSDFNRANRETPTTALPPPPTLHPGLSVALAIPGKDYRSYGEILTLLGTMTPRGRAAALADLERLSLAMEQ